MKKFTVKEDVQDMKGWTIPKGTELFIMNDKAPKHPTLGHRCIVVRVNNGTDDPKMCPETVVRDTEIGYEQ